MDFCRNISVSGGLPSEYQPEQLLSSSKLGSSLDDLFSSHNMEGDVSLEWLSIFVEDCFSSGGNCLPPAPKNELQRTFTTTTTTTTTTKIASEASKKKPLDLEEKIQQKTTTSSFLHKFVIPGKARSKRKRGPAVAKSKTQLVTSWSHHHQNNNLHLGCSSDPPLLQQAYWLADSELILPKKEDTNSSRSRSRSRSRETERAVGKEEEEEEEEMVTVGGKEKTLRRGSNSMEEGMGNIIIGGQVLQVQGQQGRRCSHCLSQRTPQWRAGPMGPKTLCNACGVRYKSGRLLPEYRPAKSPTFVSYKHSNSHKKVLEMRELSLLSSIPIPSTHQHS